MQEFSTKCGGKLVGDGGQISGFATDSRTIKPGDLFLAVRGANVDGHRYVENALALGAVGSLVEEPVAGAHILVENLVNALAAYGKSQRDSFDGPVIGVTGSAGKTTTKEFISAALGPLGSVLKTVGNRNTEYTSPLLWADLEPDTKAVVVEMAMRGFGQIEHLAKFSRPTLGVITNIGYSHIEQVGSREGIARAKGELLDALPPDGAAVLWHEDEYLETLRERAGARKVVTFGESREATCRIRSYRPLDWTSCEVKGVVDGVAWCAVIPSIGRHIAINAAAAVLVASLVGVKPEMAAAGLAAVQLPPMRMEIRKIGGATVLLDTYNASPNSMITAIETLADLAQPGRRKAVIGEMRELGEYSRAGHESVGRALAQHQIDDVLFFGPSMNDAREAAIAAGGDPSHLTYTEDIAAVHQFLTHLNPEDAVLMKGSRALELERALEGLS